MGGCKGYREREVDGGTGHCRNNCWVAAVVVVAAACKFIFKCGERAEQTGNSVLERERERARRARGEQNRQRERKSDRYKGRVREKPRERQRKRATVCLHTWRHSLCVEPLLPQYCSSPVILAIKQILRKNILHRIYCIKKRKQKNHSLESQNEDTCSSKGLITFRHTPLYPSLSFSLSLSVSFFSKHKLLCLFKMSHNFSRYCFILL